VKITVDLLQDHDACRSAIDTFVAEWPDGGEITASSLARATELNLDIEWLTCLMEGLSRRVYDATRHEHQRVYRDAMDKPRRVYYAAIAAPQRVYDAAIEKHQRVYRAALIDATIAGLQQADAMLEERTQ